MKFQPYEKISPLNELITSSYARNENTHSVTWAVTEMLDGDHLTFYANQAAGVFRAATRKRFLHENDNYSIWKDVAVLQKPWLLELSKALKQPIIVYGKVIGGHYKGTSNGRRIASVCEYLTFNDYVIHDLKVAGEFISIVELENLARRLHLSMAPILFRGKFTRATGYPENKLSLIPFIHSLPAKYDNEMKGIIIRPVHDLHSGFKRMILKKLNRKYVGQSRLAKEKLEVTTAIIDVAEFMANEAKRCSMLDIVINHFACFDMDDVPHVAGKYVEYMVEHINYVKYQLFTKEEKKLVHKQLNKLAAEELMALLTIAA